MEEMDLIKEAQKYMEANNAKFEAMFEKVPDYKTFTKDEVKSLVKACISGFAMGMNQLAKEIEEQ